MARYQITERADLGHPFGFIDPREIGGVVVVELPKKQGDRLIDYGAATATEAAVTYPKSESKPTSEGGEGEGGKPDPKAKAAGEGGKPDPKAKAAGEGGKPDPKAKGNGGD